MIDGLEIAYMSALVGELAKHEDTQPFVPTGEVLRVAKDGDLSGVNILDFGDYRPDRWELTETYFVDSSGFGQEGEPALTLEQFIVRMVPGKGYATIEHGQFQVYVGEFERTEEGT